MKKRNNVLGFALLFVCVALASMVSILIFNNLQGKQVDTWLIALLLFLNIIVISLLYSLIDFVRRKLTIEKQVKSILKATEKIASGDFNIQLLPIYAFGQENELDQIMVNINKMARELSSNEIQKSDFIANFSHEVKTPIASMNNYLTLLSDYSLSEEQRKDYMACLSSSLNRLTTLTSEILKLNKLENGALASHKETLHLDAVLSDCILSFENKMDEKEIDLECDIEPVVYETDKLYFETIAGNLVSNAIKFSPQGGKIEIKLSEDESCVSLSVTDHGCGMSKETGKHIFEKFYQGDTSHSGEGNGLGLAMVKRIVDIIGGSVNVNSELGKGSNFTIRLKKGIYYGK